MALMVAAGRAAAVEPEQRLEEVPAPPNLSSLDAAKDALKLYAIDLSRAIGRAASQRDYPREARAKGWEGLTKVRVKIGADGLIEDVMVSQSSGFTVLDDSAVSKVRSVALPEIPKELRERVFTLEVPFRFQVRGRAIVPPEELRLDTRADPKEAAKENGLVLPGPSLK